MLYRRFISQGRPPIPRAAHCSVKTLIAEYLPGERDSYISVILSPGKKRQSDVRPRRVISRNDEVPKPARKKYCYRGSKKPYKFIPETFRDCHLPANEETVIGSAEKPVAAPAPSTSKRGRGGRRSRMSKPVTVPTPSPPVAPPSAIAPPPPPAVSVPGLTPISPATHHDTRVSSASTINLVPVTSMSTPTFENSKLLKAVPIGNGLYRLEETNESEMAGGALSKPLFTTDIAPNSNIVAPANLQLGSNIPLTNSFNQRPSKPMSVIEHHPVDTRKSPAPASVTTSSDQSSQLTSLLSSVITNMKSDSVPLMIPATSQNTVSHASNPLDLITTQPTISNSNSGLSSSLVTQILERLLSPESSSSPEDQRILEALSSSSLAGISTHH